jgi:hypothetical protein
MGSKKLIVLGENFTEYTEPESMGLVNDVRYVKCYWPRFDSPTVLFADGSSGIEVCGPPTPRNIVFPPDTVFGPIVVDDARVGESPRLRESYILTRADCFYSSEVRTQDVVEMQQATKVVEIESGLTTEVAYQRPVVVRKDAEVTYELDLEQAAQIAEVDRDAIVPIMREKA